MPRRKRQGKDKQPQIIYTNTLINQIGVIFSNGKNKLTDHDINQLNQLAQHESDLFSEINNENIALSVNGEPHSVTPLFAAITLRHNDLVIWLLENKADANKSNKWKHYDSITPLAQIMLLIAEEENQSKRNLLFEIQRRLLNHGADPNAVNSHSNPTGVYRTYSLMALHCKAPDFNNILSRTKLSYSSKDLVSVIQQDPKAANLPSLLKHFKSQDIIFDIDVDSHILSLSENDSLVNFYYDLNKNNPFAVTKIEEHGKRIKSCFASSVVLAGRLDVLKRIFSKMSEIQKKEKIDFSIEMLLSNGTVKSTLLMIAAGAGHSEIVKWLLDNGADPLTKSHLISTKVLGRKHGLLMGKDMSPQLIANRLVQQGANPSVGEDFKAIAEGCYTQKTLKRINNAFSIAKKNGAPLRTALILAMQSYYADVVDILCQKISMLIKDNDELKTEFEATFGDIIFENFYFSNREETKKELEMFDIFCKYFNFDKNSFISIENQKISFFVLTYGFYQNFPEHAAIDVLLQHGLDVNPHYNKDKLPSQEGEDLTFKLNIYGIIKKRLNDFGQLKLENSDKVLIIPSERLHPLAALLNCFCRYDNELNQTQFINLLKILDLFCKYKVNPIMLFHDDDISVLSPIEYLLMQFPLLKNKEMCKIVLSRLFQQWKNIFPDERLIEPRVTLLTVMFDNDIAMKIIIENKNLLNNDLILFDFKKLYFNAIYFDANKILEMLFIYFPYSSDDNQDNFFSELLYVAMQRKSLQCLKLLMKAIPKGKMASSTIRLAVELYKLEPVILETILKCRLLSECYSDESIVDDIIKNPLLAALLANDMQIFEALLCNGFSHKSGVTSGEYAGKSIFEVAKILNNQFAIVCITNYSPLQDDSFFSSMDFDLKTTFETNNISCTNQQEILLEQCKTFIERVSDYEENNKQSNVGFAAIRFHLLSLFAYFNCLIEQLEIEDRKELLMICHYRHQLIHHYDMIDDVTVGNLIGFCATFIKDALIKTDMSDMYLFLLDFSKALEAENIIVFMHEKQCTCDQHQSLVKNQHDIKLVKDRLQSIKLWIELCNYNQSPKIRITALEACTLAIIQIGESFQRRNFNVNKENYDFFNAAKQVRDLYGHCTPGEPLRKITNYRLLAIKSLASQLARAQEFIFNEHLESQQKNLIL